MWPWEKKAPLVHWRGGLARSGGLRKKLASPCGTPARLLARSAPPPPCPHLVICKRARVCRTSECLPACPRALTEHFPGAPGPVRQRVAPLLLGPRHPGRGPQQRALGAAHGHVPLQGGQLRTACSISRSSSKQRQQQQQQQQQAAATSSSSTTTSSSTSSRSSTYGRCLLFWALGTTPFLRLPEATHLSPVSGHAARVGAQRASFGPRHASGCIESRRGRTCRWHCLGPVVAGWSLLSLSLSVKTNALFAWAAAAAGQVAVFAQGEGYTSSKHRTLGCGSLPLFLEYNSHDTYYGRFLEEGRHYKRLR